MGYDLWIREVKLEAFRNYPHLKLEAAQKPVVLIGPNGAGKTNVLEAISYFSPGRGLRGASFEEIQSQQQLMTPWSVFATFETPQGEVKFGTGLSAPGTSSRTVRRDGRTVSQKALRKALNFSWLTPQMDRLFMESAGDRRRFLDRLVYGFFPDHARHVAAYDHARGERLRLLKDNRGDETWLEALEVKMGEAAAGIQRARQEFFRILQPFCAERVGPFPTAELVFLDSTGGTSLAADMTAQWRQNRGKDGAAGATTWGVHRCDFTVIHGEKKTQANQCSTGEQKALLIALILANSRALAKMHTVGPILLLDEVAAHLDEQRRASLFDEICALNAQAWMTGTELSPFSSLKDRAQFFAVENGRITHINT